jgi:ParB family chromosome partitioning protein
MGRQCPQDRRSPRAIRSALTADEIPDTDKRVQFIGLDAYEQAGGTVRRDMFGEDIYVQDVSLLEKLVAEKLAAAAISAGGWKWVETVSDLDYDALSKFSRRHAEAALSVPLSDDDVAEILDAIDHDHDAEYGISWHTLDYHILNRRKE